MEKWNLKGSKINKYQFIEQFVINSTVVDEEGTEHGRAGLFEYCLQDYLRVLLQVNSTSKH